MAERRMFAKSIIDSDAFLDLPSSAQALYFHLAMRADDDGFVDGPRKIQREVRCSDDDMKLLIAKSYLIAFESGVIVIKHWRLHNYIQKDRYKETLCVEEKARLISDNKKGYELASTDCIHNVYKMDTQDRLGKDRLGKDRLESEGAREALPAPSEPQKEKIERQKYGQYGWVRLSAEEYSRLLNELGEAELKRCIAYIDESAQSTGNKNKWRDWNLVIRKCHRDGWGKRWGDNAQQPRNSKGETGFKTSNPFLEMLNEEREKR